MDLLVRVSSLAVISMWVGAIGCARDESRQSGDPKSIDAASIQLVDIDGNPFDLWGAGQKRVRVVVFTRSDCPVSNRHAPDIRALHEKFHPRGVDFYLVFVDPSEQPDAIRRHLSEFDYPCPAVCDPQHTLVAYTQATVTPEAVVFAADGQITYRGRISDLYAGLGDARAAATQHDLHDAIEATLGGQPIAEPVTKAIGCYIGDLK